MPISNSTGQARFIYHRTSQLQAWNGFNVINRTTTRFALLAATVFFLATTLPPQWRRRVRDQRSGIDRDQPTGQVVLGWLQRGARSCQWLHRHADKPRSPAHRPSCGDLKSHQRADTAWPCIDGSLRHFPRSGTWALAHGPPTQATLGYPSVSGKCAASQVSPWSGPQALRRPISLRPTSESPTTKRSRR